MDFFLHNASSIFDLRPTDQVYVGNIPYVVKRLARGGMGFVLLLAQNTEISLDRFSAFGLRLAVKTVLPDVADEEGIRLFRRELTVWAGFRHPNIVSLLSILDSEDAGWIAAMDWCQGSLRDIMDNLNLIPLKEATDILGDILSGLDYAYKTDHVVHLDLKPENILYDADVTRMMRKGTPELDSIRKSRFLVSDWGLASIKQIELNKIAGLPLSSETAANTFNNMGTILYMAPERFKRGTTSTLASDMFSLGMIYVEMLTGALPIRQGIHPVESIVTGLYLKDCISLLQKYRIPKSIQHTILSMLAYDPHQRPRSYAELKDLIIRAYRASLNPLRRLF